MKTYEGKDITIEAFFRGGYYILRIQKHKVMICATKGSRKAHSEAGWMPAYERKFENRGRANNYFKAIKKSHPDLHLTGEEIGYYINYEGAKVKYPWA